MGVQLTKEQLDAIAAIAEDELASLTYVKKFARTKSPQAINMLVHLMETSEDEKIQLAAANSILDRGLGKPAQDVNVGGQAANPFELVINGKKV